MVVSDKTYTVDEFEAYAAAHPDFLLELIDGRIVEKLKYTLVNVGVVLSSFAAGHHHLLPITKKP